MITEEEREILKELVKKYGLQKVTTSFVIDRMSVQEIKDYCDETERRMEIMRGLMQ